MLFYRQAYKDALQRKSNKAEETALQDIDIPENFICPIDKEIMKFTVKTPCCGTHFCDSCKCKANSSKPILSTMI